MRPYLTALISAAVIAVTISTADARPRRHHHHHHRHYAVQTYQPEPSFWEGFRDNVYAGNNALEKARTYLGDTAREVGVRSNLWCSAFLRKVTGAQDVNDTALSWERHKHVAPQVGAVVTMRRKGGGHVGIVSGFTRRGDPVVISGNHGGRVREAVYPRERIRSWVSPT